MSISSLNIMDVSQLIDFIGSHLLFHLLQTMSTKMLLDVGMHFYQKHHVFLALERRCCKKVWIVYLHHSDEPMQSSGGCYFCFHCCE